MTLFQFFNFTFKLGASGTLTFLQYLEFKKKPAAPGKMQGKNLYRGILIV